MPKTYKRLQPNPRSRQETPPKVRPKFLPKPKKGPRPRPHQIKD